ncbi:hypothetical protein OB2597_09269 [Pseudooceanicola batsensis HTCC2597]|uniref:Hedgehog/Intein (Hint) domain-containing protein n=1 Tax=Pseudooceanicola batsensis (strain ATCC BAA-863 / DSM 15984 / KCTC 12145 / HTCC2597) TaxID=252305 RepID=A3TUX6_PSEBH|nr:Hint domain-containing protein [Pseudooceanicola batsensis]EAQ04322.1 hypothetical protein OB2597_09269 [Pseudooceanicola batsensis HTCC2597]
MGTGYKGTFVISWSQTELDGLRAAGPHALRIGAGWSWTGEATRVDGPGDILRLDQPEGGREMRRRAARVVRRLVGEALERPAGDGDPYDDDPWMDGGFVVTDGHASYGATMIEIGSGLPPLVMFVDAMPPRGRDLWVVSRRIGSRRGPAPGVARGVICFTPGTRIATPYGVVPVEDLREGDTVLTKDNGPQEICWTGARRMSGARLYAMPHLRPIRIRAGAFGIDRPDDEFLVSPEHRLLVKGRAARALFNTPEVLVTARDLINGTTVVQDLRLPEVTYIHLLLPAHQVIWANGVETESFHPASAALSALGRVDRDRLLAGMPDVAADPLTYGGYARRNLTRAEAAIMMHEAA